MIDLHCHLELYPNPQEIIKKCIESNTYVLSVTTTPSAFEITKQLSFNAPRIKTALGLHPQLAHERYSELELFDKLIGNTKYVGEVGLDFSQGYRQYSEIQTMVFKHILKKSSQLGGRVISIHSRGASKEVVDILSSISSQNSHIIHWYSGTNRDLNTAIELDCWYSVNLKMLTSQKGNSLINRMPRNRILLESDGPFIQHNGKVLVPYDMDETINLLSKRWGTTIGNVKEIILDNFKTLLTRNSFE